MTISAMLVTANMESISIGIGIDCFPQCGDPCPTIFSVPGGSCAELAIVGSFAGSFIISLLCSLSLEQALVSGVIGAVAALVHTAVHHFFEKHIFPQIHLENTFAKSAFETVCVIILTQGLLFLTAPLFGTALQIDLLASLLVSAFSTLYVFVRKSLSDAELSNQHANILNSSSLFL